MNIYETLGKDMNNLKTAHEEQGGMDDFLLEDRIKVASMADLYNFVRISSDTLIHKAEKDLWKIGEDSEGQVVIQRLFDPQTKEAIKV